MADQDSPGAGAILLAAYFDIDTSTLRAVVRPFLARFPDLTGAILWNVVKLSREAGKSTTEIAAITAREPHVIEEAKKCINALEVASRHKNTEPIKKDSGESMATRWQEEYATNARPRNDVDFVMVMNEYNDILQSVEIIVEQSDLPAQVVITLQKRIYQFRRHQSYPHLSVDSTSTSSGAPQQTEQATWKQQHHQIMQSVTEKLLHLISQLIQDLEAFLQEHQQSYTTREQALQKEIIPNLALFAQKERSACQSSATRAIVDAKKTLKKILDQSRDEVWSNVTTSLNGMGSDEELTHFSREMVNTGLYDENEKLRQQLDQITFRIQQVINEAAASSRKQFNDVYQKLLSTEYKSLALMTVMDDPGEHLIFSDTIFNLTETTDDLHQSKIWSITRNMGLGAMAETFIVPTVGTSPDAIGGSFSGSFSPSIEKEREIEKKQDILRENLIAEINHYYEQFQQQLDNALNSYKDTICHFLDQQIDASIHRYQARVEALNALQKHDFQHLQQAMQAYLQQLKQHQEMLQQLRQKFSEIAEG